MCGHLERSFASSAARNHSCRSAPWLCGVCAGRAWPQLPPAAVDQAAVKLQATARGFTTRRRVQALRNPADTTLPAIGKRAPPASTAAGDPAAAVPAAVDHAGNGDGTGGVGAEDSRAGPSAFRSKGTTSPRQSISSTTAQTSGPPRATSPRESTRPVRAAPSRCPLLLPFAHARSYAQPVL